MNKEILTLVRKFSKSFCYKHRVKDEEELESYLMEKIILIDRKYDSSRGVSFKNFAFKCMSGYSFNFLRDKSRTVKIPRRYSDLNIKFRSFQRKNPLNSKELFCSTFDVKISELNEAIVAASTRFTEITDYNANVNLFPEYNSLCNNYIRSISQRDIEILQDIYVCNKKPEKVFLEWGVTPTQGNRIITEHIENLKVLQSE